MSNARRRVRRQPKGLFAQAIAAGLRELNKQRSALIEQYGSRGARRRLQQQARRNHGNP